MALVRHSLACGLLLLAVGCRSTAGRIAAEPPRRELPVAAVVGGEETSPDRQASESVIAVAYQETLDETGDTAAVKSSVTTLPETNDAVLIAAELSLDWLVREVQAVHPSVEAMSAAWQAAAHRCPQVISLDDPMFAATIAPASFGSRDVESAYALEASQKIPWPGKRALRGTAASWEAHSAAHDVATTQQKLAEAAELAYWDYDSTRRLLVLNAENTVVLKAFRDNALARYESGLVTQQDVLQADIELVNLEQRQIELERLDRVAAGRINALLRRSRTQPLPPPSKSSRNEPALPDQETFLALAIEQRPDVAAAAARFQAEQAKLELACRQYYPDTELFGRYDTFWQPRETQSDLRGQVGARINVPLYRNRLNAAVQESLAKVAQARAEYDQLALEAQAETQSAYEQVRESKRTVRLSLGKLIPAAEENVQVAQANYNAAKIDFLQLALAQRQLIEARQKQIQAQVELQRRLATLRRAGGGSLPTAPQKLNAEDVSQPDSP